MPAGYPVKLAGTRGPISPGYGSPVRFVLFQKSHKPKHKWTWHYCSTYDRVYWTYWLLVAGTCIIFFFNDMTSFQLSSSNDMIYLGDLLDKPSSQVWSLPSPPPILAFVCIAHMVPFRIPTARQFASNFANLRSRTSGDGRRLGKKVLCILESTSRDPNLIATASEDDNVPVIAWPLTRSSARTKLLLLYSCNVFGIDFAIEVVLDDDQKCTNKKIWIRVRRVHRSSASSAGTTDGTEVTLLQVDVQLTSQMNFK